MKLQFDLRPYEIIEKERKKRGFNLTRIIAVILITMFFTVSAGYLVTTTLRLYVLQDEIIAKEDAVAGLDMEKTALQRQADELRAREKVFADTLKIMNGDLPTIEVLNVLEENMDEDGIGFGSMKFLIGRANGNSREPDVVEVTGLAVSDKQIIDYSDRLRGSGIFNDVFLPVTTLDETTGMITFTLRMPVKPILEINKP